MAEWWLCLAGWMSQTRYPSLSLLLLLLLSACVTEVGVEAEAEDSGMRNGDAARARCAASADSKMAIVARVRFFEVFVGSYCSH